MLERLTSRLAGLLKRRPKSDGGLSFEHIPIQFLHVSGRIFEADCNTCGARQHFYFPAVIARFGPMSTIADIAGEVPCWFCKQQGVTVVEINVGR